MKNKDLFLQYLGGDLGTVNSNILNLRAKLREFELCVHQCECQLEVEIAKKDMLAAKINEVMAESKIINLENDLL
jgi:hypothetical protein